MFDAKRLSKSPAVFDQQKLAWINSVYMKHASLDEVVALSLTILTRSWSITRGGIRGRSGLGDGIDCPL